MRFFLPDSYLSFMCTLLTRKLFYLFQISQSSSKSEERNRDGTARRKRGQIMRSRRDRDKEGRGWHEEPESSASRKRKKSQREVCLCNKTLPLALFLHMLHINPLFMKDGDASYSCPTGRERAQISGGSRDMWMCWDSVSNPSITVTQ